MKEKKERQGKKRMEKAVIVTLLALEIFVIFLLVTSLSDYAVAVVGSPNATVQTLLSVGNSFPEIMNITINNNSNIDLTPNSTKTVEIVAIVRDFNTENDLSYSYMEFFDSLNSSVGASDDKNNHYTNTSCLMNLSYGDSNEANVTCTFSVWYYANNATWTAYVFVNDSIGSSTTSSRNATINRLLAFGLPDSINYGIVNSTQVSDEQIANVTNMGNVKVNLSLSGYGYQAGDGNAMNCTQGAVKNISIMYEKYNLTASNDGTFSLAQIEAGNYTNLTSGVATKRFNLDYRRNDSNQYVDDTDSTYWRIYVPTGVAGSCAGNIVFGATVGTGT